MKTVKLKLTAKKARQMYRTASFEMKELLEENFGAEFFEEDMMLMIDDFDDVLNYHGVTDHEFEEHCEGLSPDEVAYRKLKLIVDAYNNGVKPDFTNDDQPKYYGWWRFDNSGLAYVTTIHVPALTGTSLGSRLCFLTREHVFDAAKKFNSIYREYLNG